MRGPRLREAALAAAKQRGRPVTDTLQSKGIQYGAITALPDGSVDTSRVVGLNPDLRVRPFFAHGGTISIREFAVGAFKNEMGLEAFDPCVLTASRGARVWSQRGCAWTGRRTLSRPRPCPAPRRTEMVMAW